MEAKRFYSLWIKNEKSVIGGPRHGSQYNLDKACKQCGTGAVLTGPHVVSGIEMNLKKDIFQILDENILLSDRVADLLRAEGIDSFGEVVQKRGRRPMPFKYLKPQGELPPFSSDSTGYQRWNPCEVCGRDGYFNNLLELGVVEPLVLRYKGVELGLLEKDVLITFERFGIGKLRSPFEESVFATPNYVVSQRFVDCLERNKIRRFQAEPVVIGQESG